MLLLHTIALPRHRSADVTSLLSGASGLVAVANLDRKASSSSSSSSNGVGSNNNTNNDDDDTFADEKETEDFEAIWFEFVVSLFIMAPDGDVTKCPIDTRCTTDQVLHVIDAKKVCDDTRIAARQSV